MTGSATSAPSNADPIAEGYAQDMAGEQRFDVDGVTYSSLDEVPEPYRSRFAAMLRDDTPGGPDRHAATSFTTHSYTVDGVTYDSLDDLPADARERLGEVFADHDGDGTPDLWPDASDGAAARASSTTQHFVIDGVTYDSLDEVPAPHRDRLAGLLADHDGNGRPDVFDAMLGEQPPAAQPEIPFASARRTEPAVVAGGSPIVQRAGMSPKAKLIAAMIVVDVIVLGVVLWFVAR